MPATQPCAVRSAPEGGLLRRISAPAPGIPAARLRLGGGDGDPSGENRLRSQETSVFRHRLRCSGHGGCQGTWSVSASRVAASPPATPDTVRLRGNGRRTEKPGLWPIIYPVSQPELPSLSEVGVGITRRWLRGWGRGASGEVRCPRMRSRRRRRPAHLPRPPSVAPARGSSVQGTGGSARPRAAGDHCPGWGHVELGTRVHPPLLSLPASSATHFRAGKGSSGSRESKPSGLAFLPQVPECSSEPPGGILSPRPLAAPAGPTNQPVLSVDLSFPHPPPTPVSPSQPVLLSSFSPENAPISARFPSLPGSVPPLPGEAIELDGRRPRPENVQVLPLVGVQSSGLYLTRLGSLTVLGYLVFKNAFYAHTQRQAEARVPGSPRFRRDFGWEDAIARNLPVPLAPHPLAKCTPRGWVGCSSR